MNIADTETSPPHKFRAVYKHLLTERYFTFANIFHGNEIGVLKDGCLDCTQPTWRIADCHIDQFTGHVDKNDREIYGGDVVKVDFYNSVGIGMIQWKQAAWFICWISVDRHDALLYSTWRETKEILGNVHNPDALPEEVREMK